MKSLLGTLKGEKLVLDWRKRQAERAGVKVAIRRAFATLPPPYSPNLKIKKRDLAYEHIYSAYWGDGESLYGAPAA